VTANLYLPRVSGRRPAVLVPCGHSETGKAAETYQRVCIGLASKGYVVLIYDPIGQGERQLYWNPTTKASDMGGNTAQHSYAGNQWLLIGGNVAQVMVWDSIRAVDYLLSRPEVDGERIGMAGNSGGGTNTAYTVPLDERIKVAATCCYITTLEWRRRSWTTGDGEQNLLGQLPEGIDHADLLRLMAPRPVLVGSAALDFFPLEGARESVAIASQLYTALDAPDRIAHVVADAPHGYSATLRRATFAWMNRWLGVTDADDSEPDVPIESDADLQCTPDGQVALLGSADSHTLIARRLSATAQTSSRSVKESVVALTGYVSPGERAIGRPAETRLFRHEGARRLERLAVWPEPEVAVPGLVASWRGATGPGQAILWLDEDGAEAAAMRPVFRALLNRQGETGAVIAAVDVRGVGETAPRPTGRAQPWMSAESFLAYESIVVGQPLPGQRMRDAACALDALLARQDVDTSKGVVVIGWGAAGLLALHLGAVDERVQRVVAVETPASVRRLVDSERYDLAVSWMVPGMVRGADNTNGYDVDDLIASLAPRSFERISAESAPTWASTWDASSAATWAASTAGASAARRS
jgi:cephalosporin-C deacetylase-like acetyl esterase